MKNDWRSINLYLFFHHLSVNSIRDLLCGSFKSGLPETKRNRETFIFIRKPLLLSTVKINLKKSFLWILSKFNRSTGTINERAKFHFSFFGILLNI